MTRIETMTAADIAARERSDDRFTDALGTVVATHRDSDSRLTKEHNEMMATQHIIIERLPKD